MPSCAHERQTGAAGAWVAGSCQFPKRQRDITTPVWLSCMVQRSPKAERSPRAASVSDVSFVVGGGVTGDLVRSIEWGETLLGQARDWPQSLRRVRAKIGRASCRERVCSVV